MKLFDLHADTGYAVMKKRRAGEVDIITRDQLPKRCAGGFQWVCMASYFEGQESWEDMQEMILALHEENDRCPQVHAVKTKEDLQQEDGLYAIYTVEGMCGIREDVQSKIDWLFAHDIKIASLAWNDENALATGVRGNPERGLSDLGRQVISRMGKHHMIVDVSHANEQTFWDIMDCASGPVMATHSNARALCDHPRNLYDEQLKELAKRGGIIGVVACGAFVNQDPQKRDVAHLVEHMIYLRDLIGIEHVALGLDFMDDYDDSENFMLNDLRTPAHAQRIIEGMKHQFTAEEIKAIAYDNAYRLIKQSCL